MPFEKGQSGNPDTQFKPGNNANPEGRPVGSKNRATVLRKWLDTPFKFQHPQTGEQIEGTLEDAMILGQIAAATNGGPQMKEILDSVYGKQESKVVVDTPQKVTLKIGGRSKPAPAPEDGSPGN